MEYTDLARIDWRMGQVLLPEHLSALEGSVGADVRLRAHQQGLPAWGFAALTFNNHLLRDGVVSLHEVAAVFPSGELMVVPGNAAVSPLDLSGQDGAQVKLWLHRLRQARSVTDDSFGAGGGSTYRRLFALDITASRVHASSVESLPLAWFRRDTQGQWELDPGFIPPLLLLRRNPFTPALLTRLRDLLEGFRTKLVVDISNGLLSGLSLAGANTCLKEALKLEALLGDLRRQCDVHPYTFYAALRSFLIEAQFYQGANDAAMATELLRPYEHDELRRCLEGTIDLLGKVTAQDRVHPQILPFERVQGQFVISHLPDELAEATQVFLLIQKPRVGAAFDIGRVKLGARSRLQRLHRLALIGVPMKAADVSPFPQQFGPETEFYLIESGEEWRHAMTERTLAFYIQDGFENINASLVWRFG